MSAVQAAREPVEHGRLRRLDLGAPAAALEVVQPPAEVWVVLAAGALILPLWALIPAVPAAHVAALLVRRRAAWSRWLPPAVSLIAAGASGVVAKAVLDRVSGDARLPLAGLAASAVALLAYRTLLDRSVHGIDADASALAVGVVIGALWRLDPLLVPFAAVPPLLVRRSLAVPRLQEEARLDVKTGLYNARHFAQALEREISRARRYRRPLALIMVDLDLLRHINNTYGHLAGDAVLEGVGEIFREQVREQDVAARFGGEEFAILLPETGPRQALELAERIRRQVERHRFRTATSEMPIRATISLGVAAYPRDAEDVTQLIHRADLAVYKAKVEGRNRVVDADDTVG